MAPNHHPSMDHHADEEDFIDIEVSSSSSSSFSSSNLFCYTINSPPKTIEFEFQMSSAPSERASTTSPADELFYKGKLLPLHLPPRLQMVQKLLQNTTFDTKKVAFQDESSYPIPFTTTTTATTPSTTTTNTPLESCNISPSESCRVSSELNPDEHFFDWSNELSGFISDNNPKRSWSKKLKLIKQSSISQKLKASRAYLKSIFSKSVCSDQSCAKAASTIQEEAKEDLLSKYIKGGKKSPFGQCGKGAYYPTLASVMRSTDKEMVEEAVVSHRKSFSGAFKRQSATKCSSSSSSSSSGASSLSSSFSVNSSGFFELEFFKRSGGANSEIENSIEGAIAHCKQSQQMFSSGKTGDEVGLCSLSASRIAVSEDKER